MSEHQHTVLVVEDEIFIREEISQHLEGCGFRVLQAGNAVDAVKALLGHPDIDLVFTDVRMPGEMDGLQLAAWVLDRYSHMPVTIASGDVGRIVAMKELCGGHAFTKPYHPDEVASKITAAIHLSKSRQA
jgi:CheY-like chemotaxis protein